MAMVKPEKPANRFQGLKWEPFALLFLLEILFALLVLRAPGTTDASNFFLPWMERALKDGLSASYRAITDDYPPLSTVILFIVAKIGALFSLDTFLSFKSSLGATLLGTTLCFAWWTRDAVLTAVLAFSLYLNGVALGYIDTYWAPTFILSLWALREKKVALFSALFAFSSLIKWQPLIVAPFLVLHAFSLPVGHPYSFRMFARRAAELIAPAAAVVLPAIFVFGWRPMIASLDHALNQELLSGNALNFNWLVTWFMEAFHSEWYGGMSDGIVKAIIIDPSLAWAKGIKLVFALFYLGAFWRLFRSRNSFSAAIECSLVGYLSYFVFSIGVHENHLFLATVLAVLGVSLTHSGGPRAVFVVAASNLNLVAFYGFTGTPLPFSPVVGVDVSVVFSAVNVLLFLFVWSELVFRGSAIFASRVLTANT